MDIRSIFFDETGRVRSGWRFGIFCLGFIFVIVFAGTIAGVMLRVLPVSIGETVPLLVNAIPPLVSALLVGWLCGKYLEGLPFRALGAWFSQCWLRNLIAGIAIGGLTLTLAVVIAMIGGGLQFSIDVANSCSLFKGLALSLVIFAMGAAWEEALFRGYLLQTLSRSGLAWLGIALTSIFFGIIHTQNPNADAISTLNTMLAGVWFGVAYMKTRDLWFVWGMHLMWNWMQGSFFGIEVSGLTTLAPVTFLKEIDSGPAWLTGESYGVEGGIVTTIALIVSTVVIWYIPFLKPSEEMLRLTASQNPERQEKAPHLV